MDMSERRGREGGREKENKYYEITITLFHRTEGGSPRRNLKNKK